MALDVIMDLLLTWLTHSLAAAHKNISLQQGSRVTRHGRPLVEVKLEVTRHKA